MDSCGSLLHSERSESDEGRQGRHSVPDSWLADTTAFLWSGFATGLHLEPIAAGVFVLQGITTRFIHTWRRSRWSHIGNLVQAAASC